MHQIYELRAERYKLPIKTLSTTLNALQTITTISTDSSYYVCMSNNIANNHMHICYTHFIVFDYRKYSYNYIPRRTNTNRAFWLDQSYQPDELKILTNHAHQGYVVPLFLQLLWLRIFPFLNDYWGHVYCITIGFIIKMSEHGETNYAIPVYSKPNTCHLKYCF